MRVEMKRARDFDVLLSFAGTEREYARAISNICNANGLKVFLDEDFQHEIWGRNLVEYLDETYRTRGKYCVALISNAYCQRTFTRVERRSAFDRMIQTESEYFLPVIVDDSWPKGLSTATAYLDLRKQGVLGICEILVRKVKSREEKLNIPPEINIPRIPFGRLKFEHLVSYLIDLCQKQPITIFGTVVYDENTAEIRKLFSDQIYWDALDAASGPRFEVFAIRDDEECETEIDHTMELMTAASLSRSRSRTYYFSQLLKNYFGEERTRMAYPSVLLFIVANGKIQYSRLIPFKRDNIEKIFRRLQDLFSLIASTITEWERQCNKSDFFKLWDMLKDKLLKANYTLYIQQSPENIEESISKLCGFVEVQESNENG